MFDKELVKDILLQVYEATQKILKRFEPIRSANDFTNSEYGMEKLDAICMQLIAIGESIKNLEKITENDFLGRYPEIEWKKIKGMRDIIIHHYFDVDAEVIYDVCKNHINNLAATIKKMLEKL
jgi:uncharacterized protein with HEPN domain